MTQLATVLTALEHAGPTGVTNGELSFGLRILRYAARIHELRALGYVIRTVREEDGCCRFILEGSPQFSAQERTPSATVPPQVQSPTGPAGSCAENTLFNPGGVVPKRPGFYDLDDAA